MPRRRLTQYRFRRRHLWPFTATLLCWAAIPASAGEALVSIGADQLLGEAVPTLAIEARGDFPWRCELCRVTFTLSYGAAAEIDRDADLWVGAGLVLNAGAPDGWRLEASLYPGVYVLGDGVDLGTDFPMFRSSIGLSHPLAPGWRAGVSVSHKSNGGAAALNPGVETLLLSVYRAF